MRKILKKIERKSYKSNIVRIMIFMLILMRVIVMKKIAPTVRKRKRSNLFRIDLTNCKLILKITQTLAHLLALPMI